MKMKILITSGGTMEKIDDVRVVTNISTGKLGSIIANKFIEHGHDVTYVAPRTAVMPDSNGFYSFELVTNTDSVLKVMERLVPTADIVIHSAAISDFTFKYEGAIKCGSDSAEDFIEHMRRTITKTPKVISNFRNWNPNAVLVGFKFTSGKSNGELMAIAKKLMADNKLDMVLANDKQKIQKSKEHVGTLITDSWEEKLYGKDDIASSIYENSVRIYSAKKMKKWKKNLLYNVFMNKGFSKDLCDKNDGKAKTIATAIMRDIYEADCIGKNIGEENKTFSDGFWDLKFSKNGKIKIVEAEMKSEKFWDKENKPYPFRFSEMDIPLRKKKNRSDYFLVISTDESYAFGITSFNLRKHAKEINKVTIYEHNGGDYYRVNLRYGKFFHKINNKWCLME